MKRHIFNSTLFVSIDCLQKETLCTNKLRQAWGLVLTCYNHAIELKIQLSAPSSTSMHLAKSGEFLGNDLTQVIKLVTFMAMLATKSFFYSPLATKTVAAWSSETFCSIVYPFSCAHIQLWMPLGSLESTQEVEIILLSATPQPILIHLFCTLQTFHMHANHEKKTHLLS